MSYKNGCHIATGCIYTYIHTYIHTHTHTHTHIRKYTHTYTQENKNTDFHKEARIQSQESVNTGDEKDFTVEEIGNAVENMGNKKAPVEYGITGEINKSKFECEINKSKFESFPGYITVLYNGCLRRGVFPTRWKRGKLIPITITIIKINYI